MTGPEHYVKAERLQEHARQLLAAARARGASHLARPGRARRRASARHLGPGRDDRAQR